MEKTDFDYQKEFILENDLTNHIESTSLQESYEEFINGILDENIVLTYDMFRTLHDNFYRAVLVEKYTLLKDKDNKFVWSDFSEFMDDILNLNISIDDINSELVNPDQKTASCKYDNLTIDYNMFNNTFYIKKEGESWEEI